MKSTDLTVSAYHISLMSLQFFSPEELESYYNSPFEQISPTDSPRDEFMIGGETIECAECGEELQTSCADGRGFSESAYCGNCEILFSRSRSPVIDNVDYQYQAHRVDEREEYVCIGCGDRHPLTEPDMDFTHQSNPYIHSYEAVTINCPCGSYISISSEKIPFEVSCDSCSRTFVASVD